MCTAPLDQADLWSTADIADALRAHDADRRDALFRSRRRLLIGTVFAAECFFLYRLADGGMIGAMVVAMLPFLLALAIAAGPIELANRRLEAWALDHIATVAGYEFEMDAEAPILERTPQNFAPLHHRSDVLALFHRRSGYGRASIYHVTKCRFQRIFTVGRRGGETGQILILPRRARFNDPFIHFYRVDLSELGDDGFRRRFDVHAAFPEEALNLLRNARLRRLLVDLGPQGRVRAYLDSKGALFTTTGRLHRERASLLFFNPSEKVARRLSADAERAFAGLESVEGVVGRKRKADAQSGRPPT